MGIINFIKLNLELSETDSVDNLITANTISLVPGNVIILNSSVGGLTAGTRYFILDDGFNIDVGESETTFKVSTEADGEEVELEDFTGSATFTYTSADDVPLYDINGTVVIDYTIPLNRIADELELLRTSFVGTERIVEILEDFYELASGPGIRTVTPYEWVSLLSTYKFLVEENKLFDSDRALTEEERDQILAKIASYIEKIDQFLPPKF